MKRLGNKGAGLHIRQTQMCPHPGFSIGPIYREDIWVGGGIEFAGVEMLVLLDSGGVKQIVEQSTGEVSDLVYRPGKIGVESPTRKTEIELEWKTWKPTARVLYQRS